MSSTERSATSGASRRVRQAVDAAVYALAVAAVVFVVGAILGFVVGGGLVTAKYVMFVVGLLAFGYGTLQLRPDPPWSTEEGEEGEIKIVKEERPSGTVVNSREETAFQAAVQRIPPLPWYSLPPDERISVAFKIFLAGLATLGWSFAMEAVFGVVAAGAA
ncbi:MULTISPECIES: hypothetical protein [Halorussus]|uniref:DUF7555 family protein n=1 Tax=Halorussus TaxID=1070314 RepID=UPI000E216412|nr:MULTISPECIES: hypothetical protein [Halorussus]NHN60668.1 hypothetical protein [Halorussus sp. JP-T4]